MTSNPKMEEGECSSSLDFELNQLRGRLDRRNALLDIIRKAYHRDVLVVKEHLQRQCLTTNTNDTTFSNTKRIFRQDSIFVGFTTRD